MIGPYSNESIVGSMIRERTSKALMKKHNIHYFATASDLKASVVERFNHTLKGRMWRYFTANSTLRYLDVLPDLAKSYNHSYHSSIKMTTMQVTEENTPQVFENLYGGEG